MLNYKVYYTPLCLSQPDTLDSFCHAFILFGREMEDLSQQAIASALAGNWQKAVELNLKLLEDSEESIDALNRLARAYSELGDISKAKEYAKRVLDLDPLNSIAQRSLERWQLITVTTKNTTRVLSAQSFLEEPGKTKTVSLINLTDPKTLLALNCGDCVDIAVHPHSVSVVNSEGQYIGRIPDDLSHRLRKLISYGNTYLCIVKCANPREVKIFIKELKRSPEVKHIASFSTEKISYVAFTAPELVHSQRRNTAE